MNKKDWIAGLKTMKDLLETAKRNVIEAQNQKEELEFNISNYKRKIKGLR